MFSILPDVVGATRPALPSLVGTPAGMVVVRVSDLLIRGETVVTAGSVPSRVTWRCSAGR